MNLFTALSLLISREVPLGPAIVQSALYANSMMVLVNDRIFIPCDTSRFGDVELGDINETALTQPVPEGLTDGEPSGVQAAEGTTNAADGPEREKEHQTHIRA